MCVLKFAGKPNNLPQILRSKFLIPERTVTGFFKLIFWLNDFRQTILNIQNLLFRCKQSYVYLQSLFDCTTCHRYHILNPNFIEWTIMCVFEIAFRPYDWPQISYSKTFFSEGTIMCCLECPLRVYWTDYNVWNLSFQNEQSYVLSGRFYNQTIYHRYHTWNPFFPKCTAMCAFKFILRLKDFSQISHLISFFPEWTIMCVFKAPFRPNDLPQISHLKSFFLSLVIFLR